LDPHDERQLVERARQGSIDCFGQLYDRYYAAMVGLAYSLLLDRHLAEDAAQETFAAACRSLRDLRDPDRFAGWLASICRNVSRDMIRSRRERITADPPEVVQDPPEYDDTADAVKRAIRSLPEAHREVIYLRYYNGLSYERMAQMLGSTVQAVNGRILRAKRILEKFLKRDGLVVNDHET